MLCFSNLFTIRNFIRELCIFLQIIKLIIKSKNNDTKLEIYRSNYNIRIVNLPQVNVQIQHSAVGATLIKALF